MQRARSKPCTMPGRAQRTKSTQLGGYGQEIKGLTSGSHLDMAEFTQTVPCKSRVSACIPLCDPCPGVKGRRGLGLTIASWDPDKGRVCKVF